ncbi:hypothetical protein D3C84_1095890 [compost metagenome]
MLQQSFNESYTAYQAEFHYAGEAEQGFSIVVNMADGVDYEVEGTGCTVHWTVNTCGGVEFQITDCMPQAAVRIRAIVVDV